MAPGSNAELTIFPVKLSLLSLASRLFISIKLQLLLQIDDVTK